MMRNLIGATIAAAAVATFVGAATVGAQPQRGPGGPGGPGGRGRGGPPVPMMLLDENCDGNLDQGEIARAPQNLLKLDRNGDGMLTRDELRPPRPEDGQPPPNPPCGPEFQQQQPRQ